MKRKEKKEIIASKKADLERLKAMEARLYEDWKNEKVPEEKRNCLKDLEVARKLVIDTETSIKEFERKEGRDKTPIIVAGIGAGFSFLELMAIMFFEKNEGLLRSNGSFSKWKLFK